MKYDEKLTIILSKLVTEKGFSIFQNLLYHSYAARAGLYVRLWDTGLSYTWLPSERADSPGETLGIGGQQILIKRLLGARHCAHVVLVQALPSWGL